ncbi:MAG: insulinase family protein [Paludibacteraceae bacterium]|nr:insulinase family protein [Paludibacteraceae bacterium]
MNDTFYKKLANGVRIVLRHRSSAVTYVGVMVGSGTRDEQQDESGLAHYIEHCVFKGCRHSSTSAPSIGSPSVRRRLAVGKDTVLTAKDIIDKVEGVGGEINAYTTKEETTFYAATQKSHWRKTLTLIADMIQRPTFPKEETDKEVGVILDEIDSYEDSPSELIYDDFENLIFQGHHLANPILGTKKSVRAISKKKSTALAFMTRQYRPERMVVFVQGDVAAEQVFKTVDQLFGHLCNEQGKTDATPRQTPAANSAQTAVYKKHTHQVHVMLGGRAYPIGHEKQLTLYLLNNILGGGSMSSRLNMQLREKRGLVYTIESQYTPLSDSGYWSVYFASDAKDKDTCISLIKKQLQLLCTKPLSPHQLKQALQQLHGQMAISAENQENNVLAMAKLMLYHNCAPHWEDTFQKIAELTPEDLVNVAREIFCESNISVLSYE